MMPVDSHLNGKLSLGGVQLGAHHAHEGDREGVAEEEVVKHEPKAHQGNHQAAGAVKGRDFQGRGHDGIR